ncbi:DNA-binding response OmpR family regulator [Devosia sp. UYZn731]
MNPIALLLEDEPLIAMDLEATLEKAGFDVVTLL